MNDLAKLLPDQGHNAWPLFSDRRTPIDTQPNRVGRKLMQPNLFLTKMLVCALSSRWFFPASLFRPICWLTFAGVVLKTPKRRVENSSCRGAGEFGLAGEHGMSFSRALNR
jgi:hypothetical protein